MAKSNSNVGSASKGKFGKSFNTSPGRLVFPQLDKPESYEGGKAKFSCQVVTADNERTQEIITEVNKIGVETFGEEWTKTPDKFNKPFMTGKEVLDKIASKGKEITEGLTSLYTNKIRFSANANVETAQGKALQPPTCYLSKGEKLPRRPGNEDDLRAIAETFYAGAVGRMAVTVCSYAKGNTKGVKLILKGVQFLADGDRLGGADVDSMMEESFDMEGLEFGDEVTFDDADVNI